MTGGWRTGRKPCGTSSWSQRASLWGGSAVERVRTALVERDEALRWAREDLAGARTVAVEWEVEVASVRAQLQQDRATLEGARA
jgi:hypothetical protein